MVTDHGYVTRPTSANDNVHNIVWRQSADFNRTYIGETETRTSKHSR